MEESKKTKKKKKSRRLFSDEAEAAVVKRERRIQKASTRGLRNNPNTDAGERREVPIEAIPRRRRRSSRDQSTHSQSYSQDTESHLPPAAQISNNGAPTSSAEQYRDKKKKKKGKSKPKRLFSDEAEAAQVKKDEQIERAIQKEEKRQLQRSIKEEERRRRTEKEIQNDGGSKNDVGKPTKSRRTFGGEIEHTKAKRERMLQKAVEKEKKKIVKKVEKTQGAEAAEAIVFRDDYEKAIEEEQRVETEQNNNAEEQSGVGDDIEKINVCGANASNNMEEPESSATSSARIDLSSASLNTRRRVATRRLFEPFPSAPPIRDGRERRKIKSCALVDWINVAWKKTAVLVHPRLMVNDLSTEQAAEPRDGAQRYGQSFNGDFL